LPKREEAAVYKGLTNIRVAFQKCAWADEQFCCENILDVCKDLINAGYKEDEEILVDMDNYSAQRTEKMMRMYRELGLHPLFTPPGCTDCVSPIDHHVGRHLQQYMAKKYQEEILVNPHVWLATGENDDDDDIERQDPNCRSAEQRRILMQRRGYLRPGVIWWKTTAAC